ncbi:MAG: extensin [Sphingomonadales bacterium 32-68-7]|nr:MAG: extensin [Sphingomonadales bacterium 12-68-11]OYX07993.1 MAG: extensin [Sphingomonadales bacterium 32-68-7]
MVHNPLLSRRIGRFRLDRLLLALLAAGALFVAGRAWLAEHPEHDPWAPLDLRDPPGWATQRKLAALRADPGECRAVLERSGVAFSALAPAGEGACRRDDRTVLAQAPLSPRQPASTCAVAAAFTLWLDQGVQPAAEAELGARVARIEHFGTFSCRRLYGRGEGPWSEHATGNALDVAAFVLADGRRIGVLADWNGGDAEAAFLRRARDEACRVFGTVLSPDYNAAHADHFHLDQAARGFGGVCR